MPGAGGLTTGGWLSLLANQPRLIPVKRNSPAMTSNARPPTAPPTIAPMGVLLLLLLEDEAAMELSAGAALTGTDMTVTVCPAPSVVVVIDVCTTVCV